jgi:hypothetical protein
MPTLGFNETVDKLEATSHERLTLALGTGQSDSSLRSTSRFMPSILDQIARSCRDPCFRLSQITWRTCRTSVVIGQGRMRSA